MRGRELNGWKTFNSCDFQGTVNIWIATGQNGLIISVLQLDNQDPSRIITKYNIKKYNQIHFVEFVLIS